MPYQGWTARHTALTYQRFVKLEDIYEVLESMESSGFQTVEGRRAASDSLSQMLAKKVKWGRTIRFPAEEPAVNLDSLDWASKVTQLREALAYKENLPTRVMVGSGAAAAERSAQRDSSATHDDALHAFYQAIRTMRVQLRNEEGVLFGPELETRLGLTWQAAPVANT